MENNNKKNKKLIIISIISIIIIIICVIIVTYAYFSKRGTSIGQVDLGKVNINFSDESPDINIDNTQLIYADEMFEKAYKKSFTITNNNNTAVEVSLLLTDIEFDENRKLATSDLRWSLYLDDELISSGFGSNFSNQEYAIRDSNITILANSTTDTYTLYIYLQQSETKNQNYLQGGTFSARISVSAETIPTDFVEASNSVANEPDLLDNTLIPVIYDEENSTWVKADTNEKWYDYDNQWWANAVTVSESARNIYQSASVGTPISMDDIETMWVWIPRYEYYNENKSLNRYSSEEWEELSNLDNVELSEVHINFLATNEKSYFTHTAFTFGDTELSGIWVAKFETGGTTSKPLVKPNITSLRGQTVSTFFNMSRTLSSEGNSYGISTNADSHMMKNIDWGAVAYLSQSKYGKYGNNDYKGYNKKVTANNCRNYITGIGADTVISESSSDSCTNPINMYNGEKGVAASTTGNIYGVYDMAGGNWEYVMGNYNNYSGNTISLNSGFNGKLYTAPYNKTDGQDFPESKYYDLYTGYYSNGYIKGDATYESMDWFYSRSRFIIDSHPWFVRGGTATIGDTGPYQATIFEFGYAMGRESYTTRLVITGQ